MKSLDVKILVHGMIKMRQLFFEVTNQDLFLSLTMPSACMRFFQSMLKKNHLALTPHMGYEKHGRQSTIARKFLKVNIFYNTIFIKLLSGWHY